MTAYYNEIDKKACAALRQLIAEGVIAPGVVDERSIKEVHPNDLRDFTQWHFFAGAGIWSVGARAAGWPDSRAIGTASCPCQPFSGSGKGLGVDDPRHLWPDLFRIIRAARAGGFGPSVWMGEQVAKAAGYGWFDGVRADLAAEGIASRTVDIPACAVDAPHERNRLYWIAVADAESLQRGREQPQRRPQGRTVDGRTDAGSAVGDTNLTWEFQRQGNVAAVGRRCSDANAGSAVAQPDGGGCSGRFVFGPGESIGANGQWSHDQSRGSDGGGSLVGVNVSWYADAEWIACHDGKARRAKPGIPMLVNGMVGRSDLWSLAGNSISPLLAAEVISAFLDAEAAPAPVLAPLPY